jgi:hypothetical protein
MFLNKTTLNPGSFCKTSDPLISQYPHSKVPFSVQLFLYCQATCPTPDDIIQILHSYNCHWFHIHITFHSVWNKLQLVWKKILTVKVQWECFIKTSPFTCHPMHFWKGLQLVSHLLNHTKSNCYYIHKNTLLIIGCLISCSVTWQKINVTVWKTQTYLNYHFSVKKTDGL